MGQTTFLEEDVTWEEHQSHDDAVDVLERATSRYIAVRRSARLPRNQGQRKGTKLRLHTAERLRKARVAFWQAWFALPECILIGKPGNGWARWLNLRLQRQEHLLRVLWPEEDVA